MKTQAAVKLAGSHKALADILEITPSAVSQWGQEIPDSRVWQLKVLRPGWFDGKSTEPHQKEVA